jgi:thiamine-phosphate pyrophosphorylase
MLVTDAAMTARHGLVETVRAAVAGGVTVVQLRDKEAGDDAMLATGRALRATLDPLGVPLVVNDRVAVAAALGAHLHIGQEDGDPAAARAAIGPDAILGLSVTRAAEVATVDARIVDYAGLGPVFATGTKADAAPALGLDGFAAIARALPVPSVAIGGIDAANAAAVMAAGAVGIAVVSAICAADDPQAAAATLRRAVEGETP